MKISRENKNPTPPQVMPRKESRKKKAPNRLQLFFIVVLAVSLIGLGGHAWRSHQQVKKHNELKKDVLIGTKSDSESVTVTDKLAVDFRKLQQKNPDAYAWLRIGGTRVDGPIMQNAENTDYYLNHTFEGGKGLPGAIYTRNNTPKDFSAPCSVLYGHNMKNGMMFGTLKKFRDEEFFKDTKHRNLQILTEEALREYTIFAAVEYTDAEITDEYDFSSEDGMQAFLQALQKGRGHYDSEVKVDKDSNIVVLSTCVGGGRNTVRYLVVGVQEWEEKR